MEWIEEYGDFMMEISPSIPDWGLWQTRSGEWMKIKDMKDSHIQNTINLLRRTNQKNDEYSRKIYELELELRLREIERKLQTIKTN